MQHPSPFCSRPPIPKATCPICRSGHVRINLATLESLQSLNSLELGRFRVDGISQVTALSALTHLSLSGTDASTNLSSLPELRGCLKHFHFELGFGGFRPSRPYVLPVDLSPLSLMTALQHLSLSSCSFDLTPLSALTELPSIRLRGAGYSDLTPLSGLTALRVLHCVNIMHAINGAIDLSPLSTLVGLQELHVDGKPSPSPLPALRFTCLVGES